MKINGLWAIALSLLCLQTACSGGGEKEAALKKQGALEIIAQRKSVRQFTDRKVEREKIDALLRAGMAAPSGMDKRPWEFVVITERVTLDSMAAALPNAKMLAQAPLAIVVCGNVTTSSLWYQDCSAVTQNILLAAEALDLGAVWTAGYPYQERIDVIRHFTGIPTYIQPLCVIPVGYPAGDPQPKDKYDESRIHWEVFAE